MNKNFFPSSSGDLRQIDRQNTIKDICSYLIMSLVFFIPISTTLSEGLAISIIILWFIDGNFSNKLNEIRNNQVVIAALAYILLHLIGLFWTEDIGWGLYTLKKQWKLLLIPIILNMTKNRTYTFLYFCFYSCNDYFSFCIIFALV